MWHLGLLSQEFDPLQGTGLEHDQRMGLQSDEGLGERTQ